MATIEKSLYLGDSKTYRLSVVDGDDNPVVITGDAIVFTAKINPTDTESEAIIVKKSTAAGGSDAEIEILASPNANQADIKILPSDTAGEEEQNLSFDIQITRTATSKVHTVVKGVLTLMQDVTN